MSIPGNPEQKKNTHPTILIVDDETVIRNLIRVLCGKHNFNVIEAANGREAIEQSKKYLPDIILMDLVMPVMDGFTALERLKEDDQTKFIPVIIITALDTSNDKIKCIANGANDFLPKPFNSEELFLRVRNNLKLKEYQDFLKNHNIILEEQIQERTAELRSAFEELESAHDKIKHGYLDTIYRLTLASEYKDEDTGSHVRRISYYTKELAESMGLGAAITEAVFFSSTMHDIGKVGIPDSILLKPGKLTADEWAVMKTHTTLGAKILSGSESLYLKLAEEIALTHHERWDGGGYPNALAGDQIPVSGRIMNIVDQYDALRSKRPYKKAFDHPTVFDIITKGDGRTMPEHFSPAVLAAFKKINGKFNDIFEAHKNDVADGIEYNHLLAMK
ncbi:MAG: two-component system response regulator [Nitrospinota bacterium]